MAYTLYIHEPAAALPRLARRGFAPGSFLSTDREWVVEDALIEAEEEGEPHAVIELTVPEDLLIVPTEDILDAIHGTDEEEWEEFQEGEEVEEGRVEAGEEEFLEEEIPEEELYKGETEEEGTDWPQTMDEAIELTETATLTRRLMPSFAVVLGFPMEVVVEEQTPEEAQAEMWYRFDIDPTRLTDFRRPFWKEMLRKIFMSGRKP